MACHCIKNVNEKLSEHNGQLAIGFGVTGDLGIVSRLLIGVEKKDKSKRAKPPLVSAAYCPFCGTKFDGCAMKSPLVDATKEAP